MSDSMMLSLNSSAFISTTGRTVMTGTVAQRTCTRRGVRFVPRQAPIPIRHPRQPDNSGNATQPLGQWTSEKYRKCTSSYTDQSGICAWAKGIEEEDDDLLELDTDNERDSIYHNKMKRG